MPHEVTVLPATTEHGDVDQHLQSMTDGELVVAVEVFDHPDAIKKPSASTARRLGADPDSPLGVLVLGRPDDVEAYLKGTGCTVYQHVASAGSDAPQPVTLVEFLTARLDEDERAMRFTSAAGRWEHVRDYSGDERGQIRHRPTNEWLGALTHPADAEHAVRWQPRRARAVIAATRAILVQAGRASEDRAKVASDYTTSREEEAQVWASDPGTLILKSLAAVYADHPDYRQEWKL